MMLNMQAINTHKSKVINICILLLFIMMLSFHKCQDNPITDNIHLKWTTKDFIYFIYIYFILYFTYYYCNPESNRHTYQAQKSQACAYIQKCWYNIEFSCLQKQKNLVCVEQLYFIANLHNMSLIFNIRKVKVSHLAKYHDIKANAISFDKCPGLSAISVLVIFSKSIEI